tara:strand:- start:1269 stop:1442 length:174 start_codon:yes stop_codon:yes gene_type:complete
MDKKPPGYYNHYSSEFNGNNFWLIKYLKQKTINEEQKKAIKEQKEIIKNLVKNYRLL